MEDTSAVGFSPFQYDISSMVGFSNARFSVELSHRTAGEPAVSGLLKVYKEYYPEVIARLDGKPSVFKVRIFQGIGPCG